MIRLQIFAHRGANMEAAENTRSAFERSLLYPIDGIETDIQLTRDEVCVLWHDRFLDKVGFHGKRIDDFDYAQLLEVDFAAQFSPHPRPEPIMALKDFLDCYRTRCRLLLEIKNRDWEPVSRHQIKVKQVLALAGEVTGDSIMVSSFNLESLVYAYRHTPYVPLVYNVERGMTPSDVKRVLLERSFLHGLCFPISSLEEPMVRLVRDNGKQIAAYTCNSDAEIGKAFGMDLDIIITDLPQKALQMRGQSTKTLSLGPK
jgi:glycerophosphoryl diester phosphodiesterase